jgi:hypothetical protein
VELGRQHPVGNVSSVTASTSAEASDDAARPGIDVLAEFHAPDDLAAEPEDVKALRLLRFFRWWRSEYSNVGAIPLWLDGERMLLISMKPEMVDQYIQGTGRDPWAVVL